MMRANGNLSLILCAPKLGLDWNNDGRVCASCLQRPCRCPDYRYGEEPDGEGGGPGA